MQQKNYYTAEQLAYLIDNIELENNNDHLKKLADRKMSRQSNSQYKLQDDTIQLISIKFQLIQNKYQQLYFIQLFTINYLYHKRIISIISLILREDFEYSQVIFQFTILIDYYKHLIIQRLVNYFLNNSMMNTQLVKILFYILVQNTAEQCIEWFYRTENKEYIKVILDIFNLQNDFQEAIQKKIVKDIKANHAKVYLAINYLTIILEDSFLISVYQNLILHYSFSYLYDFKNINNIINSIYELYQHKYQISFLPKKLLFLIKYYSPITDSKVQIVESQYMESLYEQKILVFQELFKLDKEQLKNCILYSKVYLTPKLQFNQMFQERINKDFNVQQINIIDSLKQEIIISLPHIPKNSLVEQFIGTIILNYKDLVKFIIDLYLDKLIQEQNSKFLQCLLNLISNPELKALYYQNNKKKPLMRETLNLCIEERFQNSLNNQDIIKSTVKCIHDLYKNGLMARPQFLIYIKQFMKQLCNQHANKQINIKENKIFSALTDLSNVIESSNKVKDHEIVSLENVLKTIIYQYRFNWFDIDNLITFESLGLIVKLINMYDKNY